MFVMKQRAAERLVAETATQPRYWRPAGRSPLRSSAVTNAHQAEKQNFFPKQLFASGLYHNFGVKEDQPGVSNLWSYNPVPTAPAGSFAGYSEHTG